MSRIETREAVVFFIYQYEFRSENIEDQIKIYVENNQDLEEDIEYFRSTVTGIIDNRESLDESITKYLKNWTLDRIPKLDKAILETAIYEISYNDDIPTGVAINEAVKLAKKYGTDDSYSYINGVLSSYEKSL
ncbi:MAG: transcription antitermination factor NusB [Clostridiales bacterium]|jgi:N utilization substance protein B|nr:transcription antitermination factor NusB [Clostridiales bacterium]